jgi:DNA-binding beta-propeller fold protein YncE
VIDTRTQAVATTLPLEGGTPGYLKAFHDGKHVLGADTKRGELLVIDPAQGHKVLQRVPAGAGIDKLVIDADDRRVWVSLTGEPRILELTFATDRSQAPTRRAHEVGGVAGEQFKHRALAVGAGWLVAPNSAENDTSLIDLATGRATRVSGGNNPGPVGIGTAGEAAVAALVGYKASNAITIFELPGGTPHRLDDVGLTPSDVGVDPMLGRAYVTMSGSNEVAVVDYVGKRLVGRVPVGKRPVHLSMAPPLPVAPLTAKAPGSSAAEVNGSPAAGDGHAHAHFRLADHPTPSLTHEWWVGNDDGGTVTVFDGETLRVKATIATGQGHHKLAFMGAFAYVSNLADSTISVVDRAALR